MKKILALVLAMVMVMGLLAGCQVGGNADTTAAPETKPTQSPEEEAVLRILALGNSHTNDCTQLLYYVFMKEMPEQKVLVANMYYSGCSLSQHVTFEQGDKPEYVYYKNDSGFWKENPNTTMSYALGEQMWDVIMLHDMNNNTASGQSFKEPNLENHIAYIKDHIAYPATLLWNMGWSNPTAEEFFAPDYFIQGPSGWKGGYEKDYGFDYNVHFEKLVTNTKDKIMTNPDISGIAPTGMAFTYARNVLGMTDLDLYRDYTHSSDYGALIAAYVWFATITGKTEITEMNIDVIPASQRHNHFKDQGDLVITEEMQEVLVKAVNYALANPYTIPTK